MISIIIPVYNVEQYLKKCIDSILRQAYTDYEVILIDDGSTDSSGAICDQYLSNKQFKIFHQNNQGVSSARNKGLSAATGDYILFVDPDDWIEDNALEVLIQEVTDSDLIMFNFYRVYESINNKHHDCKKNISNAYSAKHFICDPYYEILGENGCLCNKLYKRSTIGNMVFDKNVSYGEDALFIASILKNVHKAKIIPDCLYYYNIGRIGNVVSAPIDMRSLDFLESAKMIYKICVENNSPIAGMDILFAFGMIVIDKIPATFYDINKNKEYIEKWRALLNIPSLSAYVFYLIDKRGSFYKKSKRIFFQFLGRYYLYLRLLKRIFVRKPQTNQSTGIG